MALSVCVNIFQHHRKHPMILTIDSNVDTFAAALRAITSMFTEMERLQGEQRADLSKVRERVDNETTANAAAAAAFGAVNVHQPNRPDDHIPAAAPVPPAPPPPPVAPAAATPVPPAPAPAAPPPAGVALDTEGLPWDARIHAATKTKVANGSWKKKKGTDPALVASVTAELRAVMGLPAPAPAAAPVPPAGPLTGTSYPFPVPPVAPVAATPVAPAPPGGNAWPLNGSPAPAPVAAAAPVAPPAPPATPAAITTFAQLMGYISGQIAAGKWSHPETLTACQANGVTALPLLAARPDLIPNVAGTIGAMIAAKG